MGTKNLAMAISTVAVIGAGPNSVCIAEVGEEAPTVLPLDFQLRSIKALKTGGSITLEERSSSSVPTGLARLDNGTGGVSPTTVVEEMISVQEVLQQLPYDKKDDDIVSKLVKEKSPKMLSRKVGRK